MPPVDVMLVLEGGRVGEELGGMALLELGSALAAVTRVSRVDEEEDAARDPASSSIQVGANDDATTRGPSRFPPSTSRARPSRGTR